jgi:hypothetical protein
MKSQAAEIAELKAKMARLERELARVDARVAKPRNARRGIWLGKTTTTHNKGSTHDVDIYGGAALSEDTTSLSVPATNKFANIASGKWVVVVFIHGVWYIIAAECS